MDFMQCYYQYPMLAILYNDTQVNGNIINPYFSDGIWIPK